MGGISARVSKAAQSSAMITPFWKNYKLSIQIQMDQAAPAPALKTEEEIFQENITETLRSVFIAEISMRILLASNSSIFMA